MNQTIPARTETPADENNLIDLFGIVRRRRGLIILGCVIGLVLAALYYFLVPPTYRAKMEILVGQKSGDIVTGSGGGDSVEGSAAEQDVLSTHIQLMTSRRILNSAMENHDLESIASIRNVIREGGSPLDYLAEHLEVGKGGEGVARDAHTLCATFDDPSPEDCATVLRAVFEEYQSYLQEHFKGTSSQAVDLLTKLAKETSKEVQDAEAQLAAQLGESALLWDGEKSRNVHKERLQKIEDDLHRITETEAETASRLAVIKNFIESHDPDSVTDFDRLALLSEKEANRLTFMVEVTRGEIASEAFQAEQPLRQATAQAEYEDYLDLVMKEKKLREKFSDGHPQIVSLREQIALMRQFIDDNSAKVTARESNERMKPAEMLETYVRLLENDLAGFAQQREVLQIRSQEELVKAKALEQVEMKTESLRREMLRRQQVFEDTQETLKELNFVRDYAGFSTDVIGDALAQDEPYWPQPLIVLALGLFGGGFLGLAAALLVDLLDTTFANPDDVQQTLGAPVLAHVPRFDVLKRHRKDPPLLIDSSIRVHHQPHAPAAEVYRVLRTGLLVDIRANGHQVLQVTSPLPGDGKTTTSLNLAMAFAQTGKRTLIIDADLRKPRIGQLLHLEGELGFSEALIEQCEPSDVIQTTVNKNLFAVSSGSIPPNPAELLQSERFSQLINVWRESFDFIIIDTPPVLAVSDAAIVAEEADSVLLAVRITKNSRRSATRAGVILRQSGANLNAIVVNGCQTTDSKFGYSGGYDSDVYGYGYGESHKSYYGNSGDRRGSLQSV